MAAMAAVAADRRLAQPGGRGAYKHEGGEEQRDVGEGGRAVEQGVDLHPAEPGGPTAMPATISRTTAGRRTFGAKPSSKGARNAMAATTSRPPKDTSGIL